MHTESPRDSAWLRFVRAYTYNFPWDRGKGRMFKLAKRLCRELPRDVIVPTRDGRLLEVSLNDWSDDLIYFLGTYEGLATSAISRYIMPGAVCLDVGANIGWYTTLFQARGAHVHSFEPAPNAFRRLERNVALNQNSENVTLNHFGLGSEATTAELHLVAGEPEGHASLVSTSRNSISLPIEIRPLDSYLMEKEIDQVDVVKVDIEGAELMFLKGAKRLFQQDIPPVIMMEMSTAKTRDFGDHSTDDLITFLNSQANYSLIVVDEYLQRLTPMETFKHRVINDNVLCVPLKDEVR